MNYYGKGPDNRPQLVKVEDIDLESLEILDNYYFKDKNNAYYGPKLIISADIESFEYIGANFAIDKNNIYFEGTKVDETTEKTFRVSVKYGKPLVDQEQEGVGMRLNKIPYRETEGLTDWTIKPETKEKILNGGNCEDLMEEMLPTRFSEPHICGIENFDDSTVLYAIGSGIIHESLPYFSSIIIVFKDEEAIMINDILPRLNQEIQNFTEEFVEENPNFDFPSKEFKELSDQIDEIIEEELNSEEMNEKLELLSKMAKIARNIRVYETGTQY